MRKVIFAINLTIDGCCDHTKFSPYEDVYTYFDDLMRDTDLTAYGRKMYGIMFPYWADEANWETELEKDFGQRITGMDKIVFSRSLTGAEYNTRVVSTDPVAELLKLKQLPGNNIHVATVSMLPQLMRHGVIDEYHFVVAPVMAGEGTRLLERASLPERLNLKLVESKVFGSGTVALHYAKS